jgi:crotonobetainyl-CoA:carnitine CoA-transferase CaiB-like acyl-CoA transferase
MQALEGIRILDLSGGIAGPLGVLHLAEHGADVIKIEPPGGRPDRQSSGSRVYNRSRRSVTIDLKSGAGARLCRQLCATADVLVEAFAPGTMTRLGLDYDSLHADFPELVYCSVPAWPSGTRYQDLPGYEALVHARSGQHWENTGVRHGPVFLHSPVASFAAMLLVPTGIMSALVARQRTGRGQHVEVSLFQSVLSLTTQNWSWTDRGQFLLAKTRPQGIHQTFIYECAGGEWIHMSVLSGVAPTRSEDSVLGLEELTPQDLLAMGLAERDRRKRAAYQRWDRSKLLEEMRAAGFSCEAIVAPHERFDHPQLRETGAVAEIDDPEVGPTTQIGVTLFLEGTPGEVKGPQPPAGAHTSEVLMALGHDAAELERLRSEGVI